MDDPGPAAPPRTVAHVITRLELGGAQQNTLTTCRALAAAGWRVALIYGPGGELDRDLEDLSGVQLYPVDALLRSLQPSRDAHALRRVRRILAALDREHAQSGGKRGDLIVHTHSSKAGIIGRAGASSLGLKRIVHSIHGFPFHAGQPRAVFNAYLGAERAMARVTRAFIAVSRANVAEALARGILNRGHRVEVIRSGMPLDPFRREASRQRSNRAALGIAADVPLFVAVANLKPQKDPLTAVEAMRHVVADLPRAQLLYVGDGPLRGRVEARLRALGLGGSIQLLGWRRDVPRLMSAADVVVLSSRFEGLPRSAVQAVAVGRPFVGCRVDGTPEIIRAGRDGFLVEPDRPRAFAQAMIRAYRERPVDLAPDGRLQEWTDAALVHRQQELYAELG